MSAARVAVNHHTPAHLEDLLNGTGARQIGNACSKHRGHFETLVKQSNEQNNVRTNRNHTFSIQTPVAHRYNRQAP